MVKAFSIFSKTSEVNEDEENDSLRELLDEIGGMQKS